MVRLNSLGCIALLGATTQASSASSKPWTVEPLEWKPCPPPTPATLDCANLTVPMNYANPCEANVTIAIVRMKANTTKPLGNLVINPGGPGISTTNLLIGTALTGLNFVSKNLTKYYNIIGPDPRGIGFSHPVKCDMNIYNERVTEYPTSQKEFDKMVARTKAWGESCLKMTGPLLQYVDTKSVARDFDLIRQALGDEKLNYLGLSYGTFLGSQYAELFPERVGLFVLDGILEHSQSKLDTMMTDSLSYENTLKQFFQWCNTTTTCAFHGKDLPKIFDDLIDKANETPIPAPGCVTAVEAQKGGTACQPNVTGYDVLVNVQNDLSYVNGTLGQSSWADLSNGLLEATKGNATFLSLPLATSDTPSLFEAYFPSQAISCLDWQRQAGPNPARSLQAKLVVTRVLTPHTRGISGSFQSVAGCVGWPVNATNTQATLDIKSLEKAPPILLVNGLHDPETSVQWAVGLRDQMPNAVSIFRNGSGHTSYIDFGDTQREIDNYFITGKLPVDLSFYQS